MITKKSNRKLALKATLVLPVAIVLTVLSLHANAQTTPPTPPPPPPSPGEVFNKINPFKKHKKTAEKTTPEKEPVTTESEKSKATPAKPEGPQPPPSPGKVFNKLFKKKNTTTSTPSGEKA